jgi:hypothetical protein
MSITLLLEELDVFDGLIVGGGGELNENNCIDLYTTILSTRSRNNDSWTSSRSSDISTDILAEVPSC